jgi:hypothetical protein
LLAFRQRGRRSKGDEELKGLLGGGAGIIPFYREHFVVAISKIFSSLTSLA